MNWTIITAMEVLADSEADAKLWADAVEWLMIYGPPEVKEILQDASNDATTASFPALIPSHYSDNGTPCYDIKCLAKELAISEDEVRSIIDQKEKNHSLYSIINGKKLDLQ